MQQGKLTFELIFFIYTHYIFLRYFVAIYPAYIRFAQCIRRMKDSPKHRRLHHLANAAKETILISIIKI